MSQITPVNSNCNKSKKPQSPSETNKANNKSNLHHQLPQLTPLTPLKKIYLTKRQQMLVFKKPLNQYIIV